MSGVYLHGLQRFRRDERGVVLILFTLLIVPLMLIVGVAIDFSQTLVVKRQLAAAVDAAALNLGTQPDLDDEAAEQKAEDFIHAHYPEAAIGRLKSFSVRREDDMIDVSATAELDTSFLRIAGYNTLDVTVNNRVLRKQNKLEVVMVLDNTGSMAGTKIAALKTAANELVNILFGTAEESDYVKIGLVPFANAVNVGADKRGAAWLDEATPAALNGQHVTQNGSGITFSLFRVFQELNVAWKGCVRSRDGFDLTDAAPTAADKRTLFTPYFAPDEPCAGAFCSTYANNYIGTETAPQTDFGHYRNRSNVPSGGPNFNCPRPIQDLTNVKNTITSAISVMAANGQTVIPEGIAWGWRVISPGTPFTAGAPYDDRETIKAVIVLTDGDNDVNPGTNGVFRSKFSSYGYASNGHLGAVDGSQADTVLNQKTAAVCANVKADKDGDASDQDVIVYTIVFGVGAGSATETMMRDCASDPSKYFNSPTGDDLQAAFQSIALGLSKLRVAM
jgi:Flp pilus assembly protein TadG